MEKLQRSMFTAAGEIANERLLKAASEPDRYPEGTVFIAADQEDFSVVLVEAVSDHRPVVIVYPDGREVVARVQAGTYNERVELADVAREAGFDPAEFGL